MITKSKLLYGSITSLILSGGGLSYYFLSGKGTSLDAQSKEIENSENSINSILGQNRTENYQPQPQTISRQLSESDIDIKFKDGSDWIKRPVTDKYPSLKNDPYLIEQAEKYKKLDPVLYRHNYDNPFHKEIDPAKAKEKLNVLMDYSMMIVECDGGRGTAWILDYVLPQGNQKYPTKFFIASSGHVVNSIGWDNSNPYQQVLSDPAKDSTNYSRCDKGRATLIKEKIKDHNDDDFDKRKWDQSRARNTYQMWNIDNKYDVSKYKGQSNSDVNSDYWQFTLQKPKLVYFPHNYLGTGKYQEHAADFAIFEVDFGDENVAKLFTRDFYGKYDREKGTHKNKALNFFTDPLHKTYTSQQLLENDIQLWVAGYPGVGHSHKASTNYNINRKSASRLTYHRSVKDSNDRLLLGLQTVPGAGNYWNWNGKPVKDISYWYAFDNPEVEHGASGSVMTTGDNNVVGIISHITGGNGFYIGGSTPLRNVEIKDKDGKIIFHAYDFMEGVAGQNGSYKEQIQKYFLKDNKQTSLSKLRGWKTIG